MPVASAKTTSAATQDDVLDDLLEETSNLSNQNNLHQPLEMKAASFEIQSSSLRLSAFSNVTSAAKVFNHSAMHFLLTP
ncbi:hypothetical protein Peur_028819 [Populus x canadensis]